jgi:hypothetical protein
MEEVILTLLELSSTLRKIEDKLYYGNYENPVVEREELYDIIKQIREAVEKHQ